MFSTKGWDDDEPMDFSQPLDFNDMLFYIKEDAILPIPKDIHFIKIKEFFQHKVELTYQDHSDSYVIKPLSQSIYQLEKNGIELFKFGEYYHLSKYKKVNL